MAYNKKAGSAHMQNRSFLRRIINNDYAFTLGSKVFGLLIGVVASIFSNRFLGPELKGIYEPMNTTLMLVAIVANLGLYQPYPFYKRKAEPDVLDKFLNIFMLQFVCYTVLGVTLSFFYKTPTMLAVCLITPVQVLANQMSYIMMSEDVKYKNVIFLTARISNTGLIILAFLTMQPTILVPFAMVVLGDLLTIILAFRRLKRFPNPFKVDFFFLRRILSFGIVSMLTTLMVTLNYRVDTLMLKYMNVDAVQIGLYTLGLSLADYAAFVPDAFREVLFSRTSKGDAVGAVTLSLKINFYLTLIIILGIVLLGKPAILLLYGQQFVPAYGVTLVLLTGVLVMSYFKLIGTLLLSQGKKWWYFGMLSISVIINIVCNLYTIPIWGKEGAAVASVLSYTAAGVTFLIYFMKTYHVRFSDLFLLRKDELLSIVIKMKKK